MRNVTCPTFDAPTAWLERLRQEVDRPPRTPRPRLKLSESLEMDELLPLVLERGSLGGRSPGRYPVGDRVKACFGSARIGENETSSKGRREGRRHGAPPPAGGGWPEPTILVPLVAADGYRRRGAPLGQRPAAARRPGRPRRGCGLSPPGGPCAARRPAQEPGRPREDVTLILGIGREIGSTLDLDRVLRSVVNLASRA